MLIKAFLGIAVLLGLFFIYVTTREGHFRYERSGLIKASPGEIFPYISNLRLGEQWSPYEKADSNLKKKFIGPDAQVGSKMEFLGDRKSGSGSLEILKIIPNETVEFRLIMTAPMKADNIVRYNLREESGGTRFTWEMEGDGGFMGKLMTLLIDCEKMVADQFTVGINNLKALVEGKK
jgi:uncharacterized protein YndB with AHSA1/START domain